VRARVCTDVVTPAAAGVMAPGTSAGTCTRADIGAEVAGMTVSSREPSVPVDAGRSVPLSFALVNTLATV
jgi:hypothetical protein